MSPLAAERQVVRQSHQVRLFIVVVVTAIAVGASLLCRRTDPEASSPREPQPAVPSASIVQPAGPIAAADGVGQRAERGVVEVDGTTRAWAGWRTVTGEYVEYPVDAEEGESVVRFDLPVEVYDIWWLDREGRRRGTRAAVEKGQRTLLSAADYDAPPPTPAGFGVLDLMVDATWGGGLACEVTVRGRSHQTGAISTNSHGRGSITLAPGLYTVRIGGHENTLTVAEGQTSHLHITHQGEGDLLLDGDDLPPGDLAIARHGDDPGSKQDIWTGLFDGSIRRGLVYLDAGEYDIFLVRDARDKLGVRLGRAVVDDGRTTFFRYELPRGGLDLRVLAHPQVPGVSVQVRRIIDGIATGGSMILRSESVEREGRFAVTLAPGRYSLKGLGVGYRPVEVDVGDTIVAIQLAPER